MANKNIQEKELTIKWLEQTDKIIRFDEIDTTFDISEAVANFDFSKAGVKAGSKVSVKIDTDFGENGTVVYMTKSKGGSTSAGSSSAPTGSGTVKTVKAYGNKYSGSLLFTDSEEWYSCDKSLGIVDKIADYKNKTVEITTRTTEKGKKIITSITVVGGSSASSDTGSSSSEKPQNEYSRSGSGDSRQTSIEVQSCINNANLFYAHVLAGQSMETLVKKQAEIDQMIQHRALKNLELIKTLKTQA